MKIVLDAGHGPETPGKRTSDGSMKEYHFNNVVAKYVREELLQYEAVEILFTHDDSRDVPLFERTKKSNNWGANAFISIHANAYGNGGWNSANGIETYTYTNSSRESVALAKFVHEELIRATIRTDRGLKKANFQVLRVTKMPAILVECGFMTNKEEAELLKSDSYRKLCASAIVKGLVSMYGLKKKDVPKGNENPVEVADKFAAEARKWVMETKTPEGQSISDGAGPRDPITRQEVWTMLYRMGKLK